MRSFNAGQTEHLAISQNPDGRVLRYAAPLVTESSCFTCDGAHGYLNGYIRGALSITIPIGWADTVIARNNSAILLLGLIPILAAAAVMFILFNRLVARPIRGLSLAMAVFPEQTTVTPDLPKSEEKIGQLNATFMALWQRLVASQKTHWPMPVNRGFGLKNWRRWGN